MRKTLIVVLAAVLAGSGLGQAPGVRKAVWAGQFYEADKTALSALLDEYLAAAKPVEAPPGQIRAIIVPHAGYVYSGKTAAAAYALIRGQDIETVVILGPSHRVGFEGCSIYPQGGFETPLGIAAVDAGTADALIKASGFSFLPEAHAQEHSVEVQVPFIQKAIPRAKIVPVVIGFPSEETIRTLAAALGKTLASKKALVVASTDMSHFLPRDEANTLDKATIELVRAMNTANLLRKVERNENILCGGAAVLAALFYAQSIGGARVTPLGYADSTAGGGPADQVVGYFAAAVTTGAPKSGTLRLGRPLVLGSMLAAAPGQSPEFTLSAEEKKSLLRLARQAVESYVRNRTAPPSATEDPVLQSKRGVFITLTKNGDLRGCIGFTEPVYPLAEAVVRCAVYAATEDPRFRPVQPSELKDLDYEISVLTPLRKIDDPDIVEIGKHGLLISQGASRGLLLPQVAVEQKWDRDEFLAEACLKAGLPRDAWKTGAAVYVFEAIVFR
jgi:AmmeMemoRadiSam system protein B/AmmeMemoRadiSam system protein A